MLSHHLSGDLAAERTRDLLAAADAARLARRAKQGWEASPYDAAATIKPAPRWSLRRRPAPC